jgi:hypothetical protein
MELDPLLTAIALVAIAIGLGLVIYFELRFMRRRRASKIDARMIKDEAYNSMITARAVARVLDEQGKETTKAEQIIFQAENAYSRGEYARTKELAEEAKKELEVSKDRSPDDEVALELPQEGDEEGDEMEKKTLFEEEMNLPENYMQAKFMIKNVQHEMEIARERGMTSDEAEANLRDAVENFDRGEYTDALRYACRAERSLSINESRFIGTVRPSNEAPQPNKDLPDEVRGEQEKEYVVEEETDPTVGAFVCSQCGSALEEDDMYCAQCGTRVIREMKCPSCGSVVKGSDKFCRQCGNRIQ